jgi:hypothetical protein
MSEGDLWWSSRPTTALIQEVEGKLQKIIDCDTTTQPDFGEYEQLPTDGGHPDFTSLYELNGLDCSTLNSAHQVL